MSADDSPCLLYETNDKLSHFDRLVSLKGDYLLQDEQTNGSRGMIQIYCQVDISLPHNVPFNAESSLCISGQTTVKKNAQSFTYIQEIVKKRGILINDELLDLKMTQVH